MWLDMSTRWALHLGVRPSSALHLLVGLSALWLGLPGRRLALRLGFGPYVSSLDSVLLVGLVVGLTAWLFDHPCGCSTVHVVVRPFAWSLGSPCGHAALRVVVVRLAQSLSTDIVVEPRRRRYAVRVLVAPFASLGDPRRVPGIPRCVGVGRSGRQWGGGKKEGRKRATTKVMARFRDAPAGPPISWVPPCVSPPYPLVEQDCTGPHPSGEGRGGYGWMARVGSDGR